MNRHQFAARIYSVVFTALLVGFILLPSGFAQTEHMKYDKDKTLRGNARVNPSTLAMEFSLPIAGLTGRADNSLALSLEYSSKVWGTDGDTFFNGTGTRTNVTARFAERSSGARCMTSSGTSEKPGTDAEIIPRFNIPTITRMRSTAAVTRCRRKQFPMRARTARERHSSQP
jgi:hypothetical protein